MKNPKELRDFIDNLVKGIVEHYGRYIDFIILYGSAARGEFIKGVSDIDMVIQLNKNANNKVKREIEKTAYYLFWKLNEKYELGFEKIIKQNPLEGITPLYVPIFVFTADDVDWKKGKFKKYYKLINLFSSEKAVFISFKYEGIVLYGKDITNEIETKWNYWDKIKQLGLPAYVILMGFIVLPFQKTKAREYFIKSIIYCVINQIHILEKYDALTIKEKVGVFSKFIKNNEIKKDVEKIIDLKKNPESAKTLWLIKIAIKTYLKYYMANLRYFLHI